MVVNERMGLMDNNKLKKNKKRKRISKTSALETINISNDVCAAESNNSELAKQSVLKQNTISLDIKKSKAMEDNKQYPILNDELLIQKMRSVPMTNNQKGRIRQILRDSLKGTSETLLPDVINNRIRAILTSNSNLTDSDLRKMRILYNMLATALKTDTSISEKVMATKSVKVLKKKKDVDLENGLNIKKEVETNLKVGVKKIEKEVVAQKIKGPKRYVVFVGNLPLDIDKEKIMKHFAELKDSIKDVRLPKQKEGKKSTIAYVELKNEITYELALSKHHSMLGNKRINVLYSAQKDGKISKTEAKSKSAKLVALQRSGKLIGSIPMNKKRSHRRMKMKQARAKLEAESA